MAPSMLSGMPDKYLPQLDPEHSSTGPRCMQCSSSCRHIVSTTLLLPPSAVNDYRCFVHPRDPSKQLHLLIPGRRVDHAQLASQGVSRGLPARRHRARGLRLHAAEPRPRLHPGPEAPQLPGPAQVALPHHNPGPGHRPAGRAVRLLRRHGRLHAAAGAPAGGLQVPDSCQEAADWCFCRCRRSSMGAAAVTHLLLLPVPPAAPR